MEQAKQRDCKYLFAAHFFVTLHMGVSNQCSQQYDAFLDIDKPLIYCIFMAGTVLYFLDSNRDCTR